MFSFYALSRDSMSVSNRWGLGRGGGVGVEAGGRGSSPLVH